MASLQTLLVFRDEATRLNSLYWSSRYTYGRTAALLRVIAETAVDASNPRVTELWGAKDRGERSVATLPFDQFLIRLDQNAADLRAVSILQICSAFENALAGLYLICALYRPDKLEPKFRAKSLIELLKISSDFEAQIKKLGVLTRDLMKGKYSARAGLICKTWGIPRIPSARLTRLNAYYDLRHLIAHDQGLIVTDRPERSALEITSSRVKVSEQEWKGMLDDFNQVLEELNDAIVRDVVTDSGLQLAVHRIVTRDGKQMVGELQKKLCDEWRFSNPNKKRTLKVAEALGFSVKQKVGNQYEIG